MLGLSICHIEYFSLGRDANWLFQLECFLLAKHSSIKIMMIPLNWPIFINVSIQRKPTPPFQPKHQKHPMFITKLQWSWKASVLNGFVKKSACFPCRPHVRSGDRSLRNQLYQEVMACIDVLRVRDVHGVSRELYSTLVIFQRRHTRCPHPRHHKTEPTAEKAPPS